MRLLILGGCAVNVTEMLLRVITVVRMLRLARWLRCECRCSAMATTPVRAVSGCGDNCDATADTRRLCCECRCTALATTAVRLLMLLAVVL